MIFQCPEVLYRDSTGSLVSGSRKNLGIERGEHSSPTNGLVFQRLLSKQQGSTLYQINASSLRMRIALSLAQW